MHSIRLAKRVRTQLYHIYLLRLLIIGEADSVYWAASEVERLIQGWEQHADAVNLARNESVMQNIADIVGTGKSAKQVRMKVSI